MMKIIKYQQLACKEHILMIVIKNNYRNRKQIKTIYFHLI